MQFALICVLAIVALGLVAALSSALTKGGTDEPVVQGHDCSSCINADGDCKIKCLLDEKKAREKQ